MLQVSNKLDELFTKSPITNVYGVSRSVLAMGTFLTLIFNSTQTLFPKSEELTRVAVSPVVQLSLFEVFENQLSLAKFTALLILFLVIIGFYPRYTGILHWYVTFSFFASCSVIDGGDHVASVFSLLLIPITIVDSRKWHWQMISNKKEASKLFYVVGWFSIFSIRIQASVLYLHAGVAKLKVNEWVNGTATYYWFTHHYHGAANWLKPLIISITSTQLVVFITWSVIIFEILLFAAIFLDPQSYRRKYLLLMGILFHFAIAIIHGLISFFFSMSAVLLLYLLDHSKNIAFIKFKSTKP